MEFILNSTPRLKGKQTFPPRVIENLPFIFEIISRYLSNPLYNVEDDGIVSKTFMDDSIPGCPVERTITYVVPFERCDREADCEIAWANFKKNLNE